MRRYSSRRQGLDREFINQKLKEAVSYDRLAGFFRSSILEVAGEALEKLDGTIRVVCNSDLSLQDIETAKAAQQAIRRSWCEGKPDLLLSKHPFIAKNLVCGRIKSFLSRKPLKIISKVVRVIFSPIRLG